MLPAWSATLQPASRNTASDCASMRRQAARARGTPLAQVIFTVTIHQKRLELPEDCPAGFKALCEECMSSNSELRPKFTEVCCWPPPPCAGCAPCCAGLHCTAASGLQGPGGAT